MPRVQKNQRCHNLTGRGRTQWKYNDKLDKILGSRPATRPRVLLETLESQPKEPSSDETDIGDLEDDYKNSHSSTSAADGYFTQPRWQ